MFWRGLAFLVVCFWMLRRKMPIWFCAIPMAFMLIMPGWALISDMIKYFEKGEILLGSISVLVLALEAWMIIEAAMLWPRARRDGAGRVARGQRRKQQC